MPRSSCRKYSTAFSMAASHSNSISSAGMAFTPLGLLRVRPGFHCTPAGPADKSEKVLAPRRLPWYTMGLSSCEDAMPKQKTHKGLAKRVKVTARGKVVRRHTFRGHLMSGKS
ncbi:MAG: large ribosomal subunit protein bL35, partial [Phycisphaerae bacterium]